MINYHLSVLKSSICYVCEYPSSHKLNKQNHRNIESKQQKEEFRQTT